MSNVVQLPTSRFSTAADNIDKYHPGYPDVIISYLQQTVGLRKRFRIADIGSGAGIFSELLLKHGYRVKAIEPDSEMRAIAETRLGRFSGFKSIHGTAEETGINDQSVDLITVAQAFHRFKPLAAKKEFSRILKAPGYTLLVWNIPEENTPFLAAYREVMVKYKIELRHSHRATISSIHAFFRPAPVISTEIQHSRLLAVEDVIKYLSSYYVLPLQSHPANIMISAELEQLFQRYSENGFVQMGFQTKLDLSKIQE